MVVNNRSTDAMVEIGIVEAYAIHMRAACNNRTVCNARSKCILDQVPFKHIACVCFQQSSTYRHREFPVSGIFHFFDGSKTGIRKNWYRKKVLEPVSEKIGTGKKSQNRYRKKLVPEKSLGTGIRKNWYRKKVPEPVSVSFKILGTVIL